MRRIFLGALGLMLAIPAGALFLLLGGLAVPELRELVGSVTLSGALAFFDAVLNGTGPDAVWMAAAGAFWALVTALIVLPPIVVAVIGAAAGLGSSTWYAGGAGLLTVAIAWLGRAPGDALDAVDTKLLALLFLTGASSGFVYWAVAGREMGRLSAPGPAEA